MSPWWLLGALGLAAALILEEHRRLRRLGAPLKRAASVVLERAREQGCASGAVLDANEPLALARDLERCGDWIRSAGRRWTAERGRLGAVLDALSDGAVVLDQGGRVLLANQAARRLWPLLEDSLEGRHLVELFQEERLEEALERALASGQGQEADMGFPAAGRRPWHVRVLPLRAPGPEAGALAASVLVLVQDPSPERAGEQIRRDFVANVSHELQTPLTSVRGYAETLAEEDLAPEERRRFAEHILREAERMTALVRDLLALAQLEAPRWAPAAPLHLETLAAEVVAQESAFAASRAVTLVREPGDAVVSGRAEELRRALQNLVRNALAYTPSGGRVRVRVQARGTMAAVSVEDTGIGIPAEALPRIFERFYRVDPGRSRSTGGTGLGLAIVKHTAEGHRGRVEVHSELGRGSTFTLLLPLVPGGQRVSPAE